MAQKAKKWKEYFQPVPTSGQDPRQFLASSLASYRAPTRIGGGSGQYLSRVGGRAKFDGRTSYSELVTTLENVEKGDAVITSTNGDIETTAATNIGDTSSNAAATTTSTANSTTRDEVLDISATVKLQVGVRSGGTGAAYSNRIVVVPSTGVITSCTQATISTTTAFEAIDASKLSATTAIVVYGDNATSTIYGKILSGLDTTTTVGAEQTLTTAGDVPENALAVVAHSATAATLFYRNASNDDIEALALSISGATITAGATATIVSDGAGASVLYPFKCVRFGTSDFYLLTYVDTTGGTNVHKAICGSYIDSTWSFGSAVTLQSIATVNVIDADYFDDKFAIVAYKNSTSHRLTALNRVGTILTAGTQLNLLSGGSANEIVNIARLGKYTVCVGCGDNEIALVRRSGNTGLTLAQEGSTTTLATVADTIAVPVYFGPNYVCIVYYRTNYTAYSYALTTNYSSVFGIAGRTALASRGASAILSGYSPHHTGLTVNTIYYAGIDGALVTAAEGGSVEVGVALSSTELKITL